MKAAAARKLGNTERGCCRVCLKSAGDCFVRADNSPSSISLGTAQPLKRAGRPSLGPEERTFTKGDAMRAWAIIWNQTRFKDRIVGVGDLAKGFATLAVFPTREEAVEFSRGCKEWDIVPMRLVLDGPRRAALRAKEPRELLFRDDLKVRKLGQRLLPRIPAKGVWPARQS